MTPQDIANCDQDFAYIGEVANTLGTATNRAGTTTKTIPQLIADQKVASDQSAANATAAQTAAAAALSAIANISAGQVRDLADYLTMQGYLAPAGAFVADQHWLSTPPLAGDAGKQVVISGVSHNEVAAFIAYDMNGNVVGTPYSVPIPSGGTAQSQAIVSQAFTLPANTATYRVSVENPATYPSYTTWSDGNGNQVPVPVAARYLDPSMAVGDLTQRLVLYGFIDSTGAYNYSDGSAVALGGASFWRRTPPIPVRTGFEIAFNSYAATGMVVALFRDSSGKVLSYVSPVVVSGLQSGVIPMATGAATVELCTANPNDFASQYPLATTFAPTFTARATTRRATPTVPAGGLISLIGDSRFCNQVAWSNAQQAWQSFVQAEVQGRGLSGHTVAQNASDADMASFFPSGQRDPNVIPWLPGGNDAGGAGTVGTFSASSVNGVGGEPVVTQLPLNTATPSSSALFIQCIDLGIRKIIARYADTRTRAGVTSSDTEAQLEAKLLAAVQPRLVMLTDLPQRRLSTFLGIDPSVWNSPVSWARKQQAIIEAAKLNGVEYIDTMGLLPVNFGPQPPQQSTATVYGDDYYDWLHPFLLHYRIAGLCVGRLGLN